MSLTKRKANYIWHCINNHDGFAEDCGEWMEGCGIEPDELEAFMDIVRNAIEEIKA